MEVLLRHYSYYGGTRDGEWGVYLEVDGMKEDTTFLDDGDALEYFIANYLDIPFKVSIRRDYSEEE